MENQVLEIKPVEVFGRSGAACERTEGDAITFLAIRQGGFELTSGAFVKINLMLSAAGEDRWQAATGA